VYLFTESARDMIACRGRALPAMSITADALQSLPVGSHVLISNFEIVVQYKMTSSGMHAERLNVPVYSPGPASTNDRPSVYVTLSQETAGTAAVLSMHSEFSQVSPAEQFSLPPLDAVIISRDDSTIHLVESSAAFTYLRIMMYRGMAMTCAGGGFAMVFWLFRGKRSLQAIPVEA